MRILVTNDDGIYAPGLWAVVESLSQVGDVVVVAPDREQSAVGTSVTLHMPVRARPVTPQVDGVKAFSVEGTPADSVILALGGLVEEGVDLVVSGINEGSNLGNDVLISGTVGAAFQGHFRGLTSMALSVAAIQDVQFDDAAQLALLLAAKIKDKALPQGILLNVNLPNIPREEMEGIEITRLARRSYADDVQEGHDGKRTYYWIVRSRPEWEVEEGTDIWAIRNKRVSITPLQTNLTSGLDIALLQNVRSDLRNSLGFSS